MSELIKHECGVALIRLLKPLDYYRDKYGDTLYGLTKMYLLMEKQHNRGQDGAGIATIKFDMPQGHQYVDRMRSTDPQAIKYIFNDIFNQFSQLSDQEKGMLGVIEHLKLHYRFTGELLLGHLRYGTHGGNDTSNCHPRMRSNNWMTRTLIIAGNFNLTNVNELFDNLIQLGQFPREMSDTMTVLEKIGHFLDSENQRLFKQYKNRGLTNQDITPLISQNIDIARILRASAEDFDGGYVMAGLIGHGDAFVMRDPSGIRPAYWYKDDEVVVVASERPAIQSAFNVHRDRIHEVDPGSALIIKRDGSVGEVSIRKPMPRKSCSFERIYFSRGSDADIYQERKQLGRLLVPGIMKAIENDIVNTVFSYIPNTAEVAFLGMIEEVHKASVSQKIDDFKAGTCTTETLQQALMHSFPRVEKIANKDVKLRTFITEDASRSDMVSHVYDVTYGLVKNERDTLVVLDDSIVRGTTLEESILKMLDKLQPKKIIVVSSAPQIRYPDCYGIDMSKLGNFVAFRAAIALIKERGMEQLLDDVYKACKAELEKPLLEMENVVRRIYEPFTYEEVSRKIADIIKPKHIFSDVDVIYQTVEDLHTACPNHTGDWYFTGDYPTPGGARVAIRAFVNFMEGRNVRAY